MVKNSKKGWKIYSFSLLLTFSLVFLGFTMGEAAEMYPTRSINMIVPYAPASERIWEAKSWRIKSLNF